MPLPNTQASPLDAPPPLPPAAPPAKSPTYQGMVGPQGAQPPTPGGSQLTEQALRMGMEIDMALKLLAQAVPQLGPWVIKTTSELRQQLGQAVSAGLSTSPQPTGATMPDGSANL